jgi:glutamate-1-semialdehyde 2,1-aminomutase
LGVGRWTFSPFRMTSRSSQLFADALKRIPGGVNSPVRAFRGLGREPFFVDRAQGSRIWDVDDNEYIDYVGTWGPAILGHAPAVVIDAVRAAASRGVSFGIPNPLEVEMAELICRWVPSIEKVRMVNSGTEATMSCLRLARGFTGRDKIIKFEGCYHGHSDGLLVKAGSGVATLGIPGSAGVPEEIAALTMALPFNNLAAVAEAFAAHPGDIAAIILEPVVGNAGCIAPAPGYLAGLRELTSREGALLIADEVMSGFRVALGGALERYNLDADLVTLGKIVGGGLPVGVFGGKRRLMDLLAPLGPVYQAGTLSGNPLAMAAGIATIGYLQEHAGEVYPQLEATAKAVTEGVAAEAAKAGVAVTLIRVGSMWTWFFTPWPVTDYTQAASSDLAAFGRFHRAMLDAGVWLPPSQFEAAFLGTAHGKAEVAATIEAARGALQAVIAA